MDHKTIQDQLFALYDGELTGAVRRSVESHVAGCAECRALMAQWQQTAGRLFRAPRVATSEAFVERVMRRIATPDRQPFRLPRWILEGGWLVPALGFGVMLLVMVRGPLEQTVSIESLLLSDGREPAVLQQVLTGESPNADDILGLLMEEAT